MNNITRDTLVSGDTRNICCLSHLLFRLTLVLFLTAGLVAPAAAADRTVINADNVVVSKAGGLKITISECRNFYNYQPPEDIHYKPGVDVHGKPVVPADIGQPGIVSNPAVPEDFTIDITVLLQERFGIPADSSSFFPEANIGVVEYRDGDFFFNGQRLSDVRQRAVQEACKAALKSESEAGDRSKSKR